MIKKAIHTAMVLLVLSIVLIACQDEYETRMPNVPDGYVALRFRADIPAMQEVTTRAVDEDGKGVQNMTLFCFDTYGLFVTTVTAKVTPTSETEGTFDASVPDHTRIIHFVANQNMSEFPEDNFLGKAEAEVMALLQGSSGRMIYWARFACAPDNTAKINEQMSSEGIKLIRNHAQISLENPQSQWIEVTGFKVYNTNAFGTVAPYHPQKGFDFTWPSDDSPFVTLPDNKAKMSDIQDVVTDMSQYVFECENKEDDPVSVIIRGHLPGQTETDDLYYRVMLVNDNGEQILIRRNHHYKVNIDGTLAYGQKTFAEALEAAATNNVWISISEDVKEVEDQNYILAVEQTTYVLDPTIAPGTGFPLHYTVKGKNGQTVSNSDKPSISWLEGNTVASETNIDNTFTVNNGTGEGTIIIYTQPLEGNIHKLEGTLLVKKGRLQRKIKVIKMQEQTFVPSWMGAQLYGKLDETDTENKNRPKATAVFTIPETCPQELFPMRVLLSVNALDVRSASGMTLSIIRKGDEGYGADNDWGYKYVYMAESPGVQRVYFESILNQTGDDTNTPKKLIIEADHFKTMELEFMFSEKTNTITLEGLESYNATDITGGPKDEAILYRLVPQKKGAKVQFDMQMKELDSKYQPSQNINATRHDEFLIYTSNLLHYDKTEDAGVQEFDCEFHHTEATAWAQKHNPNGGQTCMFTPIKPENPTAGTGKYAIYMYTNKAKSAEVIRIASNLNNKPAVLAKNAEGEMAGGLYIGETYRSVIFELANYTPFRFAARVNYDNSGAQGNDATGSAAEPVTPLTWSYNPGKPVDIEIDITSFAGSDKKSADPFGRSFEIYIDAPMLEIDVNRLNACHITEEKLKVHPEIPGRFIYTVDANREQERKFGIADALSKDGTTGVQQTGERKRLPFKVKNVVSAEDIVISSDEKEVVYFAKTFRVSNSSITGTLKYKTNDGSTHDVPHNSFVPFERTSNNSRIGAITVTADGQYELRLRKEYAFNWNTDKVELRFENPTDKIIYSATVDNLATLFANPHVVLEPETARGN